MANNEIDALLGELADHDGRKRETARHALAKTLDDDHFDARWHAAEGLIGMRRASLAPVFDALIHDGSSRNVREGAHHVLPHLLQRDLLTGRDQELAADVLSKLDGRVAALEAPEAAAQAQEALAGS